MAGIAHGKQWITFPGFRMNDETLSFLAELEQTESLASASNQTLVPSGERPCPICGNPMEVEEYPCNVMTRIHIDVCGEHGVWLDRGELPKIIAGTKCVAREKRVSAVKNAKLEGKKAGYIFGAWAFLFD